MFRILPHRGPALNHTRFKVPPLFFVANVDAVGRERIGGHVILKGTELVAARRVVRVGDVEPVCFQVLERAVKTVAGERFLPS